jgi:hypothetical protein
MVFNNSGEVNNVLFSRMQMKTAMAPLENTRRN